MEPFVYEQAGDFSLAKLDWRLRTCMDELPRGTRFQVRLPWASWLNNQCKRYLHERTYWYMGEAIELVHDRDQDVQTVLILAREPVTSKITGLEVIHDSDFKVVCTFTGINP